MVETMVDQSELLDEMMAVTMAASRGDKKAAMKAALQVDQTVAPKALMMAVLTVLWGRKMVDPSDSLGSRLVDSRADATVETLVDT